MLQQRCVVRNSKQILQSVDFFCCYYALIRKYIRQGGIVSSLDRGAFTRPQQVLSKELYDYVGKKSNHISHAYGPESGDYELIQQIREVENLKHGTNYTDDSIAITAGAWCGVELVLEEIAGLRNGKTSRITVSVVGPTHYQMFHRAINMLGVNVVGFDFVLDLNGRSTPISLADIDILFSVKPDAIFIANPNNPNGEYFPSDLLKKLIKKCEEENVYLIIDEIQDFLPSTPNVGLKYGSWIQSQAVIRIDSFSKKRALAEHRIGWVIASKTILGNRLTGVIGRLSGLMGNAPRAGNSAIWHLLELEKDRLAGGNDRLSKVWNSLNKKEYYIKNRLQSLNGATVQNREACINVVVKFDYAKSDLGLSEDLMKQGVLIMPCGGYGYNPDDTVIRITFAERWKKINYGVQALLDVVKEKNG